MNISIKTVILSLFIAWLTPLSVFAKQISQSGVITDIYSQNDEYQITFSTNKGAVFTVNATNSYIIARGKKDVRADAIQIGDTISIVGVDTEAEIIATTIKTAAPKKVAAPIKKAVLAPTRTAAKVVQNKNPLLADKLK